MSMKLDFLDEAVRLRDRRKAAERLGDAITSGPMNFHVWHEGINVDVLGRIDGEFIRSAVRHAVGLTIYEIDCRLAELGMCHKPEEPKPISSDVLLSEIASLQNSWIRALGGRLKSKRHLIDALVMTTEEMVDLAGKYKRDTVPKAEHDRRVTELLEANNEYLERARKAERELKAHLDGSDAERLALAIGRTTAEMIAAIKEGSRGTSHV
ncbi:hypothetical protein [Bradyrhizobium sp. 174]|uniref:hypothetical protein n=1 Tax=Bradyrhizobium sp. 174 TaxID=2782645 RepID=UPI001FFA0702|nr:hypothetical protein [Bradyrhizobium sp. 174]MCK1577880.1 hypothetical protein [Bradyrhizobium sp. 174]